MRGGGSVFQNGASETFLYAQEANCSERRCVCCFVSETTKLPWDGRTRQQGKRRNPSWAKSCLFFGYLRDWHGWGAQNQRGPQNQCQIISWRQFISHLGFIRASVISLIVSSSLSGRRWAKRSVLRGAWRGGRYLESSAIPHLLHAMISCTSAQLENMISVIPSAPQRPVPRQNGRPVPNSHDWFRNWKDISTVESHSV